MITDDSEDNGSSCEKASSVAEKVMDILRTPLSYVLGDRIPKNKTNKKDKKTNKITNINELN